MNPSKMPKLDNEQDGDELILALGAVEKVQEEIEELECKVEAGETGADQKYDDIMTPLYQKRSEKIKAIPDFWMKVFINHPYLSPFMNEDDLEILKHLTDVEVKNTGNSSEDYSITFNFSENEYFENKTIVKQYLLDEDGAATSKCTPILWKPGKGITEKINNDEKTKKRSRDEPFPSLISCLVSEKNEEVEQVGIIIRDDIWPNPLPFYMDDDEEEDYISESDDEDDEDDVAGEVEEDDDAGEVEEDDDAGEVEEDDEEAEDESAEEDDE